jgi:hypothetical protein
MQADPDGDAVGRLAGAEAYPNADGLTADEVSLRLTRFRHRLDAEQGDPALGGGQGIGETPGDGDGAAVAGAGRRQVLREDVRGLATGA